MIDTATRTPAVEVPAPRRWPAELRQHAGIVLVTTAALIFYLVHAVGEQLAYRTTGYDLGIFDQAMRAYAHFKAPMVPLKGPGFNIFGDHFHPIIIVLTPLYWIWDTPMVLVVAQAVLTAIAIPVVYRFALRRTSVAMATAVAFAFAASWAVQSMIDFDFHEIAFATPILALAVDALDRERDRELLIWAGLLLLVREDMGVIVALLGVLVLAQRRGKRRLAAVMIVVGLATYLITTSLIIPHFSRGAGFAYSSQFGSLGPNLPSALEHIVLHPLNALQLFFQPHVKLGTMLYLLVPLGFLSLRSRYSILALPLLAERFFNTRGFLWEPHFHYNALPWLILVMAAVDGGGRLRMAAHPRLRGKLRHGYAAWLIVFPFILVVINPPWKVISINEMRDNKTILGNSYTSSARDIVAHIPPNTCVEADNHLVPHLTHRDYVTLPQAQLWHSDFIALDMGVGDVGGNPPNPRPPDILVQAFMKGYTVVYTRKSFVLLRSADYRGPSSACKPLGPGKTPTY